VAALALLPVVLKEAKDLYEVIRVVRLRDRPWGRSGSIRSRPRAPKSTSWTQVILLWKRMPTKSPWLFAISWAVRWPKIAAYATGQWGPPSRSPARLSSIREDTGFL